MLLCPRLRCSEGHVKSQIIRFKLCWVRACRNWFSCWLRKWAMWPKIFLFCSSEENEHRTWKRSQGRAELFHQISYFIARACCLGSFVSLLACSGKQEVQEKQREKRIENCDLTLGLESVREDWTERNDKDETGGAKINKKMIFFFFSKHFMLHSFEWPVVEQFGHV